MISLKILIEYLISTVYRNPLIEFLPIFTHSLLFFRWKFVQRREFSRES